MLDMIMPGLSGGETFDRLREIDPMSPHPPVQRVQHRRADATDDFKTGAATGFLQKPFLLEELSRKIREILY